MKIQELAGLVDAPFEIRTDGFSELMLNHLMNVAEKALEKCPRWKTIRK